MIATTYGAGPFHPALHWYGRLWVAKITFETEEEAASVAEGVISFLNGNAVEYINGLGYDPQA